MNKPHISTQMNKFWEEQQEERNNLVTFEVITGGKDGGDNLGPWLDGLEEKTAFLVQEVHRGSNMPRYGLLQFYLVKRFHKSTLLADQREQPLYVEPHAFCSQFRLHEILYDPRTMPEITYDEKEDDAISDRSEPPSEGETENLGSPKVS